MTIYAITIYPNQIGRKPFEEYGPEPRWFHMQATGFVLVLDNNLQPLNGSDTLLPKEAGIIENEVPPGWTNVRPHYILSDSQAQPVDVLVAKLSQIMTPDLIGHPAIGIEAYAIDHLNAFASACDYWGLRDDIMTYACGRSWAPTLWRWDIALIQGRASDFPDTSTFPDLGPFERL